jgi:hypothetical protein
MKFRYTQKELNELSDNELLNQLITERVYNLQSHSPLRIRLEAIQKTLVDSIKVENSVTKVEPIQITRITATTIEYKYYDGTIKELDEKNINYIANSLRYGNKFGVITDNDFKEIGDWKIKID